MTAPRPGSSRSLRARGWKAFALVGVVVVGAVLMLLAVVLAAPFTLLPFLTDPRDGAALARENIERSVAARVERLGYWYQPTDAETLAAERLSGVHGAATFTPIGWSGRAADGESATIDVLIRSGVPAHSPTVFGERGTRAGSAEHCYRFTVPLTAFVTAERIDCPAGVSAQTAPTPTPTVTPRLPADAVELISAALAGGDLEAELRRVFPGPGVTIETTDTTAGERVVAVGTPASGDCRVVVERPDGTVFEPGFDRDWARPGEVGCSTALFIDPPR